MLFEKDTCNRYHVVRVAYIAQLGQQTIANPCAGIKNCATQQHQEVAGIYTPQGQVVAASAPQDVVDKVFETALELVAAGIARGC